MNILLHICCAPCSIYPIKELKTKGHRIAGYFYNPNIHPYSEYLKRMAAVESYSKETGLNVIIPDFSIEKSAPSDSEGSLCQIRRESGMISEVSEILPLHEKVQGKNPGYPAKRLKTPSGFFAAALRANFAIAKFGIKGECDIEKFFQFITHNEDRKNRCPICWWIRLEKAAKFAKENGFEAFTTTLLGSPYQDHDAIKEIGEEIARKSGLNFYYEDFRAGFNEAQEAAKAKGIYRQNYCGCVFSEKEKLEKKKGPVKDKAKKA